MDIKTTQPTEPTFTVTLSVTEMSVITTALGRANCPGCTSPYYALSDALENAGVAEDEVTRRARDFGLRVLDADGSWETV
jgi:hypothetical protein